MRAHVMSEVMSIVAPSACRASMAGAKSERKQ
jgi:hypothetical protein